MTDNVERQKSTRWVKEVPTYGGWGDEDEYEYEDDYETNNNESNTNLPTTSNIAAHTQNQSTNQIPSLPHSILNDYKESLREGETDSFVSVPQSDLVLSIDKKKQYEDDSDSSDEDDENKYDDSKEQLSKNNTHTTDHQFSNNNESIYQEPEPHHYHEAVPGAFKDDIRLQPDLSTTSLSKSANNLITNNSNNSSSNLNEFIVPPTPTYSEFSNHENIRTPSEASFQSDSSIQREPINLSIKNSNYNKGISADDTFNEKDEEQELTKEQTIKRQPEKLVLSVDKKKQNEDEDDDSTDDDWGYNGRDSSDDEEEEEAQKENHQQHSHNSSSHDIDSFIHELNNNKSKDYNQMQIDTSNLNHQELDHPEESPIAPLTIAQQHNSYLNDYNNAKRRDSVRKPPKKDSGDYSHIVSGYGTETEQSSLAEEKDIVSNKEVEEEEELVPPDLHPVISSGSLSTGKLSMDFKFQQQQQQDIDNRSSRRISQDTFNMNNWNQNTENFRNQFINDNDNDSTINFDSEVKSKYDKFIKNRNSSSGLSEIHSNSSSLSVPDTIDVMPNIQEDDNDLDAEEHSENHDDTTSSRLDTITTQDSILNSKPYLKPVFGEEKMTPAQSKESLPQKYNSLIPKLPRKASDGSIDIEPTKSSSSIIGSNKSPPPKISRNTSDSTTLITPQPTINFTPDKYPVSDWKSIITISQPKDRITAFKKALVAELEYETGLKNWLNYSLKQTSNFGPNNNNIHIGRIASQAYSNAPHNDLRRHGSFRSKVNVMKDKVEGTGSTASNFGKKWLNKSKKFISGGDK